MHHVNGPWLNRRAFVGGLAAAGTALALPSYAATYPDRPIRLVVTFGAGSTTDLLAREICEKASGLLGQQIVVDDRPGATGIIGSKLIAGAAPDGYSLVFGVNSTHASNLILFKDLPYDPVNDFTAVSRLASQPLVVVVNPDVPAKSITELVELAKANPGKYKFASTGNGTSAHLAGETFKNAAGVNLVHVPYTGAAAFTDLLAGRVHVMFYPYQPLQEYVKGGQLRALATTGAERAPWLPDLPTMVESGFPKLVFASWFGIYGPKGLPEDIVKTLAATFEKAMADRALEKSLNASGTVVSYAGPEEFAAFTKSEIERYREVILTANLGGGTAPTK